MSTSTSQGRSCATAARRIASTYLPESSNRERLLSRDDRDAIERANGALASTLLHTEDQIVEWVDRVTAWRS